MVGYGLIGRYCNNGNNKSCLLLLLALLLLLLLSDVWRGGGLVSYLND